jgi:hypothetical protein
VPATFVALLVIPISALKLGASGNGTPAEVVSGVLSHEIDSLFSLQHTPDQDRSAKRYGYDSYFLASQGLFFD